MYVLTAFLVLGGFPYTCFDTGDRKFHTIFTNFCLNHLCYHRARFDIRSYVLCSAFCYFISMCVIFIFVHFMYFIECPQYWMYLYQTLKFPSNQLGNDKALC